jgi:WD40 repeat protein
MLTVQGKHQLKDGFQEMFIFRGHRLQLRGFNLVEWLEDTNRGTDYKVRFHYYISWDVKQVLLWKHDFQTFGSKPQIVNQVKFSNQPNYVCAIVHVTKMKVFLAAALDMSFKIFDRQLNLLESIHHEERAILQLEYDSNRDIIFSSGATGISAWKLYRNLSLDKSHVMEKLYTFEGCETWVTHMIYEPNFNRIYALKERSAQVLSLTKQAVITTLENVHDAPINAICWYERNQFYITGCSRGEIKCWTSNFNYRKASADNSASSAFNYNTSAHQNPLGDDALDDNNNATNQAHHSGASAAGKKFALLHVFKGHTKAVTSIKLHPVSGLAISTSLDGFVKILNLEALNELFVIQCDAGIINMRLLNLSANSCACLFAFDDATLRLWKITSVVEFFAVTSAHIDSFQIFDNLEGELEYYYLNSKHNTNTAVAKQPFGEYQIPALFQGREKQKTALINGSTNVTSNNNNASNNSNNSNNNQEQQPPPQDEEELQDKANDENSTLYDKIIITESSQDVRAFTDKGVLLGRLEPEHVVDSIKAYTVSVHQKLLIYLCEGDRIRVHCLRKFGFPLLFETSLKTNKKKSGEEGNGENGNILDNIASCITLVDMVPSGAIRSPRNTTGDGIHSQEDYEEGGVKKGYLFKKNLRGEDVPDFMECFLLVGLKTGTLLFMDLYNGLEVVLSLQAMHGDIIELKYRKKFHDLFVYGKDFTHTFTTIKIYRLPDMELTNEINELKYVSCFNVSPNLTFFGVGCSNGSIHLFSHHIEDHSVTEVINSSENHDARVNHICFCDDMRIYISCSQDSTVNFWDYEKRLIRSIIFNIVSNCLALNGRLGDVIIGQNQYLLTIPRRIWDEDDFVNSVKYERMEQQQQYVDSSASSVVPPNNNNNNKNIAAGNEADNNNNKKETINDNSTTDSPLVPSQPTAAVPTHKDNLRRASRARGNSTSDTVVSGLSEPSVGDDKSTTLPSASSKTVTNAAERRMSRRLPQFDQAKLRRFSRRSSVGLSAAAGAVGNSNHNAAMRKPSRGMSIPFVAAMEEANENRKLKEAEEKEDNGDPRNIEKMVNNIKELFEKEILLPSIQQDSRLEFVGKNSESLKKLEMGAVEESKLESSAIIVDLATYLAQQSLHQQQQQQQQQEYQQQQPQVHNIYRPQPPPQSFQQSTISTYPSVPYHQQQQQQFQHYQYQQQQQQQPQSYEQFISYFDQQYQPSPNKPSNNNSKKKTDGEPSTSFDTLHPKFIIHKKPPARAMKLEDIEQKLQEYKDKLTKSSNTHNNNNNENPPIESTALSRINSRRFAQFGLSPRARLTLLNSYAAENLQDALSHPVEGVSSPERRRQSVLLTAATSHPTVKHPHQPLDLTTENIVEANLELKLQEQLVVGIGLGMKVSSQYKQHRMTIKKNDTFNKLQQKITDSLSGVKKEKPRGDLQRVDEDAFNEIIRSSKKLANPRTGIVGRQGLGLDYPTALDERSVEPSIIEDDGYFDGHLWGDEHDGQADNDVLLEMKTDQPRAATPPSVSAEQEQQQLRQQQDEINSNRSSIMGPQYNRRKPLLPSQMFNPQKMK